MKKELMYIVIGLLVFIILVFLASIIRNRKNQTTDFEVEWKALQKNCVSRKTWPIAINEADNLLASALKKRHFKGKTTGERLVAAQRTLTSNDSVWFGHKLRNRIAHEDVRKLKKKDVLQALTGFRQALRDLGVLKND
ncbi:MAG: hypothetical protein NVS1B10_00530 [Candidatus Saccharimonadales bacterium]